MRSGRPPGRPAPGQPLRWHHFVQAAAVSLVYGLFIVLVAGLILGAIVASLHKV